MSIILGENILSGLSINTKSNAHSLFDFKWSDHILNEMSWLRSDTYSWHNGDLYKAAYNHLASDVLTGGVAKTDYVEGIEIWYILGTDGHKIIDAGYQDQTHRLNAIEELYNKTGIAWYYVIDTVNKRFKLPRNKHGFVGYRTAPGEYVPAGLPNHSHMSKMNLNQSGYGQTIPQGTGYYNLSSNAMGWTSTEITNQNTWKVGQSTTVVEQGVYGNSDTVQPPAVETYLYFYVGEYSQSQAEQVATLDVELFNNKADTNMLNLSSVGKNISNWSSNVTNCITEIPQDIKMDLNNGVITFKAGSKFYIPNGFEADGTTRKFEVYTAPSDFTYDDTGWNSPNVSQIIYAPDSFPWAHFATDKIGNFKSGDTAPTVTKDTNIWYDTSINKMKYTTNTGSTWTEIRATLPLAEIIYSSSNKEIKQVYNGYGFIDKSTFILPGLKALAPNGRNSDGSLNNIELSYSNPVIRTLANDEYSIYGFLYSDGIYGWGVPYVYETDIKPILPSGQIYGRWFDTKNNYTYWTNDNGDTWNKLYCVSLGKLNKESTYSINHLDARTDFHSLDLNDKSMISGLGMPSNKWIDLTIGSTLSLYTAPANGWFATRSDNSTYICIYDPNSTAPENEMMSTWDVSNTGSARFMPVKKGQQVRLGYAGTPIYFRFIYAEGEI